MHVMTDPLSIHIIIHQLYKLYNITDFFQPRSTFYHIKLSVVTICKKQVGI